MLERTRRTGDMREIEQAIDRIYLALDGRQ